MLDAVQFNRSASSDVFPTRPIPRHASRGFVFPAPFGTRSSCSQAGVSRFSFQPGTRFYLQPGNQTMSLKRSSEISIQVSTGQNQTNSATAPATVAHAIGR
jgi:hypothetical protein